MLRIKNRMTLEGKETVFEHNGQPVGDETLERAGKRYRGTGERPAWEELSSPAGRLVMSPGWIVFSNDFWAATPPGVKYRTLEKLNISSCDVSLTKVATPLNVGYWDQEQFDSPGCELPLLAVDAPTSGLEYWNLEQPDTQGYDTPLIQPTTQQPSDSLQDLTGVQNFGEWEGSRDAGISDSPGKILESINGSSRPYLLLGN